jgi:LPS-assembly lipoprotein
VTDRAPAPGRRALLQAGGLLGAGMLAGCGFRPLYMPDSGRGDVASGELAAVYVAVLPERTGMLLRQALQARLDGPGTGVPKKYELTASTNYSVEGIGIQRDDSTTRYRINAQSPWTLRALNIERTVLATGNSRTVDGFSVLDQQYFAVDLNFETAFKRVGEALADQIVSQVAIFLKRRALAEPAPAQPAPAQPS